MNQSFQLTPQQIKQIIDLYQAYAVKLTNPYMLFRAKINQVTLTIFKTNKLLIQGADISGLDAIFTNSFTKSIEKQPNEHQFELSLIGSDEVGTGDFFGGITVCACFVPKEKLMLLIKLGVRDSKILKDHQIMVLAPKIMTEVKYEILLMNNEKYNQIIKMPDVNLNTIKAVMHNKVITKLVKQKVAYDAIYIDGFTTKEKYFSYLKDQKEIIRDVTLIERGEEKHIAIAAASIIARYHFLQHLLELSETYHLTLPKGAGKPADDMLVHIIKQKLTHILPKIAKTNFKNTIKVNAILHKENIDPN